MITLTDIEARWSCMRRKPFTQDQIELLRAGIDANLTHPSPRAKVASGPNDPGFSIEEFCNWQENKSHRRIMLETDIAEAQAS